MNMDEMLNAAAELKDKLNEMRISFRIQKEFFLESFTLENAQIISDFEIDQQLEEMIISHEESCESLNDQFLKLMKEIGAGYYEMGYKERFKFGNRYIGLMDY